MGELLISHIPTNFNLSDMLTNTLIGKKRRVLVEGLLYGFFNWFFYSISCNIVQINSLELSLGECRNILKYGATEVVLNNIPAGVSVEKSLHMDVHTYGRTDVCHIHCNYMI